MSPFRKGVVLCTVAVASACGDEVYEPRPTVDLVVEGTVSDLNGPIAGVSVRLTRVLTVGFFEPSTLYTEIDSARTDEAGTYRVEAPERVGHTVTDPLTGEHTGERPCRFVIEVRATGYVGREREGALPLECISEPQEVNVVLIRQ